jgi:predicted DNA-binding transcriptional regulator AlpA
MKPVKLPLMLTWEKLLELLGHPWERTHTDRLEKKKKDPFPKRTKLGEERGARVVWPTHLVVEWYKRKGLPLPTIEYE